MKRRKSFELLIRDLRDILIDPSVEDRRSKLYSLTFDLRVMVGKTACDRDKVASLLDLAKLARQAQGPGIVIAEERILQELDYIVGGCSDKFTVAGCETFFEYPDCLGCPADLEPSCKIMCDICAYALDIFSYKKPRDQFAGTRRAFALQILGSASSVVEISGAVEHALAALKRNRKTESHGAVMFFDYYCRARKSVPTEVRQQLLSFVERTGSRSSATGALNVLVEAGDISEFEALDRLDDWKMKWMYGGDIGNS